MRKAFKVAMVFTGAATCAAAFTPAAEAAPATTVRIQPDVVLKNCTIGPRTTSMVFTWFASQHHGPTCIGSGGKPGTVTVNHSFAHGCTGDNFGWTSNGDGFHSPFTWGESAPSGFIAKVHISGHAFDSNTCPT